MKHAHHAAKAAPPARPPTAANAANASADAPPAERKDEFVREAAYFYYEARGRIGGHELDDWLRAEAEFERLSRPEGPDAAAAGN
jgi:hypothetical protein